CAACKAKRLALQRRTTGPAAGQAAPPIVHEVLRAPGQPLDAPTRAFMEPRFGHDFSAVRVHADARAAESTLAVGALAYPVGRDVVFGAGHYQPRSSEGQRLLAHELTHVLQQQHTAEHSMQASLTVGQAEDEAEREADQVASNVISGTGDAPKQVVAAPP